MDWSNERYVRLYTRDTADWMALRWEAKALFPLLLRKADRSGVVDIREGDRRASLLAGLVGLPIEVVGPGIDDLLSDGCIEEHRQGYVIRNFLEAQEASASGAQRLREFRERRRESAKRNVTELGNETLSKRNEVKRSETPSLAVPLKDSACAPEPMVPPAPRKQRAVNPRFNPLKLRLIERFERTLGRYAFGAVRDGAALKALIPLGSDDEILERWELALTHQGFPGVRTIAALRQHWNHFAPKQKERLRVLTDPYGAS